MAQGNNEASEQDLFETDHPETGPPDIDSANSNTRQGANSALSTTGRELTWDPYDTSRAVVHSREDPEYDEPDIEGKEPIDVEQMYAKVNKEPKEHRRDGFYDDRTELIKDDSSFIYDGKTNL